MEPLIQSVNDMDWYVRWSAADALGNIGDVRALDALQTLLGDKDDYVRRAANDAIAKIQKKNQ